MVGYELAGHGYRWIDYRDVDEAVERDHIRSTVTIIAQVCGRPEGWSATMPGDTDDWTLPGIGMSDAEAPVER